MDDADLERMIGAASATANRMTGRSLAASAHVVTMSGTGRRELRTPDYPVQSITDVRIDANGGFDADTVVDDYESEDDIGMLHRRIGWPPGYRNIRIDYRGGYELGSVPGDLEGAVAEVVEWMSRRIQNEAIGIRTITSPDGINTAFDLDVPMAARNVFRSYQEIHI
jgi:hypothetical protein